MNFILKLSISNEFSNMINLKLKNNMPLEVGQAEGITKAVRA